MHRLTNEEKEAIVNLYNKGYNDSQIEKETGIQRGTIVYFRKSHNLKTKFTYDQFVKIDRKSFEELYNQGLTDAEIASKLGVTSDGIYAYRIRNNYATIDRSNKPYDITPIEEEILIGTLLGDSSLRKEQTNPRYICAHSLAQEQLIDELIKQLPSMSLSKYYMNSKPDKRTGKIYHSVWCSSKRNSSLLWLYNNMYKPKKVITDEILNKFTQRSLAWLFMDDGYKAHTSYGIATNGFDEESIKILIDFLLNKFGLHFTLCKDKSIYLSAKDRSLFNYLIKDYIIDCCKYKLIAS